MKKLILLGSAFLLSFGFVNAQGWATTGAHDDFANSTEYANGPNGEGLYWFETTSATTLSTTRGTGVMDLVVTNAGGCNNSGACYPLFGVQFGDNGGTPYTLDLSGGANITVEVENTGSKLVFFAIQLKDVNDKVAEFEPNVSDVTASVTYSDNTGDPNYYYHRKALNGFTLGAGQKKTITIDLSSVPGAVGGLTPYDVDGSGTPNNCDGVHPATCPETDYRIDASKIKAILFLVNFGKDDINVSEGDNNHLADTYIPGSAITSYSGTIKFHDFKVGTNYPVSNGTVDGLVNNSLSVYPNPADDALNIAFNAKDGAEVSLTDVVGNSVYSTSATIGQNNISVNTSNFESGIYILKIATENGVVARKVSIK